MQRLRAGAAPWAWGGSVFSQAGLARRYPFDLAALASRAVRDRHADARDRQITVDAKWQRPLALNREPPRLRQNL